MKSVRLVRCTLINSYNVPSLIYMYIVLYLITSYQIRQYIYNTYTIHTHVNISSGKVELRNIISLGAATIHLYICTCGLLTDYIVQ